MVATGIAVAVLAILSAAVYRSPQLRDSLRDALSLSTEAEQANLDEELVQPDHRPQRPRPRHNGRRIPIVGPTPDLSSNEQPSNRSPRTEDAFAGLEVKAIINEPTAAAMAFGAANGILDDTGAFTKPQVILVYDLGGGTFDTSLLRIEGKHVEVVAIDGNSRLGGLDWDNCLVDWMVELFVKEHGLDRDSLEDARPTLLTEAEELKHALTARRSVRVRVRVGDNTLRSQLTRETFEELTAHLMDRTRFTIRKLLGDSNTDWREVDRILMVGGSTRIPQVAKMLEKIKAPEVVLDRTLSPEEAVAHGAAIYAKYAGQRDSHIGPNADDVTITDVNAHHLGVVGVDPETLRRVRRVMIPKNTRLPAKEASRFQTLRENQRNILVEVVEGGDARGKHGTRIGKFVIYDLPRNLPAGTPIDVYFRYDRDGIIEVEALMPSTGNKASIRIERASGMSAESRKTLAKACERASWSTGAHLKSSW